MGPMPTQRSSSEASTSLTCPISTRPCNGQRGAQLLPKEPSRSVPCGSSDDMVPTGPDPQAREAAERAARHSYGKLLAYLAARSRDLARAEDALSEAFAAA